MRKNDIRLILLTARQNLHSATANDTACSGRCFRLLEALRGPVPHAMSAYAVAWVLTIQAVYDDPCGQGAVDGRS